MKRTRPVVLMTDFGLHDSYVGQMKGAILEVNPHLQIIDLMHELPAYGIEVAAYVLAYTYKVFPKGSVFVCVVDPGVGTRRKAIALQADEYYFVGPDNGTLSVVFMKNRKCIVRELTNGKFWRCSVSSTFHGRDVFGPTGAHIASDQKSFNRAGPVCRKIVCLPHALPQIKDGCIDGRIIHVDRFGNMLTNVESRYIPDRVIIAVGRKRIRKVSATYSEIPAEEAAGVRNSFGLLEIAMRERSAADMLGSKVGHKIRVTWKR
ncbi:MAG: SAM-dependent chlorinase/fluorinase [Candidatus Omnitrophica bacterium]|nr:SAM-dependent chlorinase/fluorinase [Candidatus Omnitrophota bacterium]